MFGGACDIVKGGSGKDTPALIWGSAYRAHSLLRGRAALGQQIERLTEAYLAGVVSLSEYERRRRDMEARLAVLARQEQDLTADIERQSNTASLAAHADAFCQRVCCGLADADFERRRALVELLIDRLIVTDSEVEIRYVFPTSSDGERERFCRLRTDYQPRLLDHHDPGELARAGLSLALQVREAAQQPGQIAAWHLMARHLLVSARRQGCHKPDGATEFQRNNDRGRVGGSAPGGGRGVGRLHGLSPPGRKSWRPYSRREPVAAHLLMAS
jgi:hypothetical protein